MLRCQKSRKEGGLGDMTMPLLADKNMAISRAYGVLKEDEGLRFEDQNFFPFLKNPSTMNWISSLICVFSFRGLFVIDKAGNLRQITINDLPVGRDVDETLRLVQVTIIMMMAMMIFLVAEMLWWSKAHNHQNPASMTAVKKFNFLQAFQFTDEHGEVCPAGWRPGEEPWWWFDDDDGIGRPLFNMMPWANG